jgi:dihydroorotate dehydrogenase electron transfer subunit
MENGVALTLDAKDPLALRVRAGDWLDALAPLGVAVGLDANAQHLLLIGEGARITPLVALAENAIAQRREVVLVFRAGAAAEIFPAHWLAPEIEYRTDAGELGSELVAWADRIFASGSDEFYRSLIQAVRAARYRIEPGIAHALIDIPMPCGTGDCYACAVKTRHGVHLACADGPFFDLSELD